MKNLTTLLILFTLSALASAAPCPQERGRSGLQFEWENDMWAHTDRWFTNGLRLTQTHCRPDAQQAPMSALLLGLGRNFLGVDVDPPAPQAGHRLEQGLSYTLGQIMYTPADITVAEPQRRDRPWAGLLYGAITVFGYRINDERVYQSSDLKFGITGRASGAGQVQRVWHRLIDADPPAGWAQQLRQRPFLQIGHLRLRSFGDSPEGNDRFGFHLGGAGVLGSHRANASLLAGATWGRQPGRNPVFAISNEGDLVIQHFGDEQALQRGLLFTNFSLTAVARNRFIDGATPYGRPELRLRRWVAAWQLGISTPLGRRWRLVYTHTLRGPEFEALRASRGGQSQRWGSFSLHHDLDP